MITFIVFGYVGYLTGVGAIKNIDKEDITVEKLKTIRLKSEKYRNIIVTIFILYGCFQLIYKMIMKTELPLYIHWPIVLGIINVGCFFTGKSITSKKLIARITDNRS